MSNLSIFNFNSHEIRTIKNKSNMTLFSANDIAGALGYRNPRKAIKDHVDIEDVTKRDTPTRSGIQSVNFINESGMYSLVLRSKKVEAKQFKRWVTSEVLPQIRATGTFETRTPSKQDQVKLTDGRSALDRGVKSLVATLSRNNKPATYKDVWKLIHLKSGMVNIELATPEQIETGMTYVTAALEGELLHPEPLQETTWPDNGMVLVNKQNLNNLISMTKMQRENFKHLEKAEQLGNRALQESRAALMVLEESCKSTREAFSKMHDPVCDANFTAGLLSNS